jgi:hypothetical protein
MGLKLIKRLLLGVLIVGPLGCEPQPVVVDPDDDTTVVEERDTIVEPDADPDAGVDVNVGGERDGVDVDVDGDAPANP